ncbi:unnamed protein product [marine sediment metagenome]|uniref:Uncharacterized protein n=1 Tax=marine sediment metagenome TaxID=412755 RepID=X1MZ96_9ZZZZ
MATKIVYAHTTVRQLWAAHEHKKGHLLGLKVDNQDTTPEKIQLLDDFTTDTGYTSGGSAYAGAVVSNLNRMQVTVPAGDCISLGEEDCKGIEFLGRALALGSTLASNCKIIAQYKLV